jgi:uncharacterized protein DUF4238
VSDVSPPTKGAKRHHTVPLMLLRRFSSEPAAHDPPLWNLDTFSGRPSKTTANKETVIGHYYRLEDKSVPLSASFVEELLSRIESDAAEPIRKLVSGSGLMLAERESMALFLQIQHQRTPTARAWHAFLDAQMHTEITKTKLADPTFVRSLFEAEGDSKNDAELERLRIELLAGLESGDLGFESGQTREVALVFVGIETVLPHIVHAMTWRSLHAPAGASFVCCDNPVNIYDPGAARRAKMDAGVSWNSSIAVEATLPLDPSVCLLVTPGRPGWRIEQVDAERVQEINLRTYAAAQQFIYGPSQRSVQQVRQSAKLNRALVDEFRPRPPQLTLIEKVEGQDQPRFTTYRPGTRSFAHPRKKK